MMGLTALAITLVIWSAGDARSSSPGDALRDGEVTAEEYRTAVANTVACANSGLSASPTTARLDGTNKFYYFETVVTTGDDVANVRLDECLDTWLNSLEIQWVAQNTVSAEDLPAALEQLSTCVQQQGRSLPADITADLRTLEGDRASGMVDVGRWLTEHSGRPDVHLCAESSGLTYLSYTD